MESDSIVDDAGTASVTDTHVHEHNGDEPAVFDEDGASAMRLPTTDDTKGVERLSSATTAETTEDDGDDSDVEEILSPGEIEHRLMEAKLAKEKGNELYKKNEFSEAIQQYSEAIHHCPTGNEIGDFESCANDCTEALDLQKVYPKVTLRRAAAYEKLERFEDALADYKAVLQQDPSNATAREAVVRLPPVIDAQREKLKDEMIGNLKKLGNMCLKPFGLSTDNFNMVQDPKTGGYSMNFTQGS